MAGEVIAGTISTANDLNPTLKKQKWKLSPTRSFAHLTIKYVYSPLSPPCSHDCFFYVISSVAISIPHSLVAPSFEWFHLFPEETISYLTSARFSTRFGSSGHRSHAIGARDITPMGIYCSASMERTAGNQPQHCRKAQLRSWSDTDHTQGEHCCQHFSTCGMELKPPFTPAELMKFSNACSKYILGNFPTNQTIRVLQLLLTKYRFTY